jgi:hypothetical protein
LRRAEDHEKRLPLLQTVSRAVDMIRRGFLRMRGLRRTPHMNGAFVATSRSTICLRSARPNSDP